MSVVPAVDTNPKLSSARSEKLARLRRGGSPRVIDLFGGCGGLSLGFLTAGFKVVAAIESDPLAALSHAWNFFKGCPDSVAILHGKPRDIIKTEPQEIIDEFRLGCLETAVDVVMGGPPCQAFARVGRAKLREVASHPEAFLHDPRSNLYLRYLHYVRELHPLVIVMENEPDVLNYGGHNIAEEVCEVLNDLGYDCRYTLLNTAFYGVPQMGERMFLVALAREIGCNASFPSPTRWVELPKGLDGSGMSLN